MVDPTKIVCEPPPLILNWMVLGPGVVLAHSIASLKEPGPSSLLLITQIMPFASEQLADATAV